MSLFYFAKDIIPYQHVLDSTGLFLEQLERQAVGQLHPFFGLALDVMDTLDSKHFPEDFGHILDNDAEMMSLSRFIVFWRGYKLHATLEPDHLEMTIFFLAARFCHAEDFLKKIFGPLNISHRHGAVFQIRLSCHVFTFSFTHQLTPFKILEQQQTTQKPVTGDLYIIFIHFTLYCTDWQFSLSKLTLLASILRSCYTVTEGIPP